MSARPHNPEGTVKMDFFRRHLFASGIFPSLPYFARCSSGLKTRVIKEKKNRYRQKDESIPPLLSNWRDTVEPLVLYLGDILPVKNVCLSTQGLQLTEKWQRFDYAVFSCGPEVFLDCPYSDLSCAAINKIQ